MILAIDARNRSVSVGFRSGGAWLAKRRFGASSERSADEYVFLLEAAAAALLRSAPSVAAGGAPPGEGAADRAGASLRAGGLPPIEAAWISSVAPSLTPRLAEAVSAAFGVEASVVGPGTRTGLKIRTDQPSEVGSDLVVAAVAARELAGAPSIVVSFGDAVAVSAVNAAGEFVGAAIAPGLETGAASLHQAAALIPEVRLEAPARAIGRNSAESVRAGLVLGYAGLVSRLVALMRAELAADSPGAPLAAVIGAGDAIGRGILAAAGIEGPSGAAGKAGFLFEPDLVLEGLAIIAARNRQ